MKKILFILSVLILSKITYSQNFTRIKNLEVSESIGVPVDTLIAPKKIGEIRYRPQDGEFYKCISLSAPKKWDYLGGSLLITNGAEDGNYRSLIREISNAEIVVKSLAVIGVGGLSVAKDTNSTQVSFTLSLPDQTGQSGKVLGTDGTNAAWVTGGGGGGVSTVTTLGTGNSNGMSISGSNINLHKVTATTPGVMTTGSDTIAGNKLWNGRSTFHDFDVHLTRAANDNFFRGIRRFDAAGNDVGGFLYNGATKHDAIGDFTGTSDSLTIFADGKAALRFTGSDVKFVDYLNGTGTAIPFISSNGTVTRGLTYLTYSEPANYGSISAQSGSNITMTVTGAAVGDHVTVTSTINPIGIIYTAYVSATNTVIVRANNITASPIDPDPATISLKLYR